MIQVSNTIFTDETKMFAEPRAKALRVTPEYFAKKAALRILFLGDENEDMGERPLINNTEKQQQLYQENPKEKSTYNKHKSFSPTDSRESYQNKAKSERTLLWWNKRIATKGIVLHYLTVLSDAEIKQRWAKISRYLRERGVEAFACLELTKTRPKTGKPN